jgi:DNA-binding MarR family transcriptional regulator
VARALDPDEGGGVQSGLLAVQVGRVVARLARQAEIALSGSDLSVSQYRLLMLLSRGSTAQSALASDLTVSRPAVTAVVDGLVRRGLVRRSHEEMGDRRRVIHVLTEHGTALLAEADAAVRGRLAEIAGYLESPSLADQALVGLGLWESALDGYRAARAKRSEGGRS